MFKTEFIQGRNFETLCPLCQELANYVKWFNNQQIHGSLNYLTPVEFQRQTL
ncbi:IS3 family transposase [Pectinatus sottacetonis]|uniref:IS3 family transposase n=1 Tax=Pectinatus sottacetonis TaxID=1002795 RepID=UPI0018C6E78F